MAKRVIRDEILSSDLSGEEVEGVRRITATIDGKTWKLDLTPAEVAELEGLHARYFDAYDSVKSGNGGKDDEQNENQAIRQWGKDRGYQVGDRGKLPPGLKADYYADQAKNDTVPESTKEKVAKNGK